MNIPSVIKLATAFVVIAVSAHANRLSEEIFSVETVSNSYPVMSANSFNGSAYDIDPDDTPDSGNGGAWNSSWNQNFVPSVYFLDFGNQRTNGNNTSTYVGPKVYMGQTRDHWAGSIGVNHANGNGYRIRFQSITSDHITGNGGNDILVRGIFMFDAGAQTGLPEEGTPADGDTPASADYRPATPNYVAPITLEAEDSWEFRRNDNIYAQLAVPATMGNAGNGDQNRASLATYRPVVMANGEYYAGTLHTVDLNAFATDGNNNGTRIFDLTVDASTTMWTKMENIVDTSTWYHNDSRGGPTNLIVDTSAAVTAAVDTTSTSGIIKSFTAGATTVAGSTLTNIQRVGFLLECAGAEHQGGINYGVRKFSANATRASSPESGTVVISWSEDFDPAVTLNTNKTGLGWGDWHVSQLGITGYQYEGGGDTTYYAPNSSITHDDTLKSVVLQTEKVDEPADYSGTATWNPGSTGTVRLSAVGFGTVEPRLTKPDDYEATYVLDLIDFRRGSADLSIRSRGQDGFVTLTVQPGGKVKFSHYWTTYRHTTFDDFNGPSRIRKTNDPTSSNNGIRITSGGTFDPTSDVPVTVTISDPVDSLGNLITGGITATATVNMNEAIAQEGVVGDDNYVAAVPANSYVDSVTIVNTGKNYVDEPTVTFSGGGMTVSPEFTFNFETGDSAQLALGVTGANNTSASNSINLELLDNGNVFNDGNQTLTIVQSYDSATDSITYYYGTGSDPVNNVMFTATPAANSAGGYGFYDVISGNPNGEIPNDSAVYLQYNQWGTHQDNSAADGDQPAVTDNYATIGLNSYSLEFGTGIDADGDGYLDRLDAFPDISTEWVDTDGDSYGDNSDVHNGLNDDDINAALGTTTASGKINLSGWLAANSYTVDDGGPSLADHTAVVTERDNALSAQATAEAARDTAIANLAAAPTLSDLQDLRAGSTMIAVSGGSATVSLQMEESSDLSSWSDLGDEVDFTVTLDPSDDTQFFRVKLAD
jgi:hypothetical protein